MLGRQIARGLGEAGYALRLTDIAPFPDPLPPDAHFAAADLVDGPAIARLAEGCRTILHFGEVSVERPFDEVLGPNIIGLHHIYEAARLARARVVFASSNHTVGFHPRSAVLDADCALRPDGFYRLSKAYGELMGWAVLRQAGRGERAHPYRLLPARPGGCADAVHLPVLCRPGAAAGALHRGTGGGQLRGVGASANSRTFWRDDARAVLDWVPQDTADISVGALVGVVTGDAVVEGHQGGLLSDRLYLSILVPRVI